MNRTAMRDPVILNFRLYQTAPDTGTAYYGLVKCLAAVSKIIREFVNQQYLAKNLPHIQKIQNFSQQTFH